MVRLLLEEWFEPCQRNYTTGFCALEMASEEGHLEVVKELVMVGKIYLLP